MAKLSRINWQIHVMKDPDPIPGEKTYRVVTNTMEFKNCKESDLVSVTLMFLGATGGLDIIVHEDVDPSKEERDRLEKVIHNLLIDNRRGSAYLQPYHPALMAYWANIANARDRVCMSGLKEVQPDRILFVGAGQSTVDNIEGIRQIIEENKAFVIAGGTAMRVLDEHEVYPHLAIAVDPYPHEKERFILSDKFQENTPLLASTALNPECYDEYKGHLIAAEGLNCSIVGDYIEERSKPIPEGSVGVSTWAPHIADYMGVKEVWLIGVDLQYGDKGQVYGDGGTEYGRHGVRDTTLEDGTHTTQSWLLEAKLIGSHYADLGIKLYQSSSSGIEIPGSTRHSLNGLVFNHTTPTAIPIVMWSKNRLERQQMALREIQASLDEILTDNWGDHTYQRIGYKYLLKQYDVVQEYYNWRTGHFNGSLIREVCRVNIDLIEMALSGDKAGYARKLDFVAGEQELKAVR